MTVRASVFRGLSGDELESLLKRLIDAERVACGLEPEALKVLSTANRGDGGIDCLLTQAPPRPTDFLRHGPLVFQFKRSYASFRTAKDLAGEARTWLRRGAGYRLVVTDEMKPDEQARRESGLRKRVAKQVGRAVRDVALLSGSHLASWFSEHPSLPLLPGMPALWAHLRTWEQWDEEELRPAGPLPWTPDAPREAHSSRLLKGLERGEAWRVTGVPGVGKTRFVLEALRAAGPAVSYLPRYGDTAENLVASSTPLFGILVVDQCMPEQDRTLRRLRRAAGLALVTIGPEEDGMVEPGETTIRLEPLEHGALGQLARNSAPHLPLALRLEVARHSGGYPQLLRLLLDAVAASPDRGWSGIALEREGLVALLRRYLSDGDAEPALDALSLPAIVSFHRDSDDVGALARAFGVLETDLDTARKRLERRGVLGTVGDSVYVTPRLLGDWLALRTWRAAGPGRLLDRLKEAEASAELIDRCLRRLDLATKEAEQVMLDLTKDPRSLVDAVSARRVGRMVSRLAASRPVEVVRVCERLLRVDEPRLSGVSWSSFMATALARAAWFEETFEPAAMLLARSLVEMPGQVETRLLTDMFAARYGQTRAPWERRLELIRALAGDARPDFRRLAASCAMAACQAEPTFSLLGVLPDRSERPWRIPSAEQDRAYRLGAASVLASLMLDPDEAARTRSRLAPSAVLRRLVREHLAEVAVELVTGLVRARPQVLILDEVRKELRAVEDFDLPKLPPGQRAAVEEIQRLFRPSSVADRISWLLARVPSPAPDETEEAARQLIATVDQEALDFLFQLGPGEGFDLGRRSGQLDGERRLLEPIRHRACKPGVNLRFAAGYLAGLTGAPTADDLLDAWSQELRLAALVLESTRLIEPSERGAARLLGMLERSALPAAAFEALQHGAWLSRVPRECARRVLRAVMTEPRVAFMLAFGLVRLLDGHWVMQELKPAWSLTGAHVSRGDHLAWAWSEAARLIARSEHGLVAQECFRLLRAEETRGGGHVAEVLGGLLTEHPESLWDGFGELMEELDSERRQVLGKKVRPYLGATVALTRQIVRWAQEGGETRRECAAYLVASVTENEGNLGAALLDAFPQDPSIRREITAAFSSGHWVGDKSDWHGDRLEALRRLATSKRPGLASWARSLIDETRTEQEQARKVESALRAGALEVPFHSDRPVMDRLFELAAVQEGYFTTAQARLRGCSSQLLDKYLHSGKVTKAMRGVYRLVNFPRSEHEDLVVLWLHFDGEAVFSHTTALSLHELSTALPQKAHVTLPARWRRRRIKLPGGVLVHHADLRDAEWTQVGPVRVTTVERTIADCEAAHVAAELIDDARREAIQRGLIPRPADSVPAEELS